MKLDDAVAFLKTVRFTGGLERLGFELPAIEARSLDDEGRTVPLGQPEGRRRFLMINVWAVWPEPGAPDGKRFLGNQRRLAENIVDAMSEEILVMDLEMLLREMMNEIVRDGLRGADGERLVPE